MTHHTNAQQQALSSIAPPAKYRRKHAGLRVVTRHPQSNEFVTLYGYEARALCELFFHRRRGCSTRFIAPTYIRSLREKLALNIETIAEMNSNKQRYILRTPITLVDVEDSR
jgi:hypothetical protein